MKDEVSKSQEHPSSRPTTSGFEEDTAAESKETDTTLDDDCCPPLTGSGASYADKKFKRDLKYSLARSRRDAELAQDLKTKASAWKNLLPKSEVGEEYCPLRHRAAIEKLLQVIEGKDPKLDSAPKVWTLVGVAKYFDCTQTVVSNSATNIAIHILILCVG